jgi:hypothetical protein
MGSDPIQGFGVANDWVIAETSIGTVTNGSAAVNASFSTINFQTDDGSIFDVLTGTVDSIEMLVVGTYLIRARAQFPQNRTGTVQIEPVISGDLTQYAWDESVTTTHYTDIATGEATAEELVVVEDLAIPASAYLTFTQTTGSSMVGCTGWLQIFRLT